MPAPNASDGLRRAIDTFAVPAVGVLILIVLVNHFVGGITAGLLYLAITIGSFIMLLFAAKYWNIPYSIAMLVGGFVLVVVFPGVISQFLHPVFGMLGTIIATLGLAGLTALVLSKLNVDIQSGR